MFVCYTVFKLRKGASIRANVGRSGNGGGGESDEEGPQTGKSPLRRNRRSPKNGAGDEEEGNIDWQAPDGAQTGLNLEQAFTFVNALRAFSRANIE